jgi:cytochrome oxidase Cu insertion factor (SCO1/SenC/PrrC family)
LSRARRGVLRAFAAAAALACVAPAFAARETPPVAPRMEYVPPAPGSYVLQRIQRVPAGVVVDALDGARPLAAYTRGRITLLTFMYTYCTDRYGCPLAYETFVAVRERLLKRPDLASRVRLVSISFDPTHDTPDAMRRYGGPFLRPAHGLEWRFLTTRSVAALQPLVDGFGQDVTVQRDERGRPTRMIYHNLKVFLIDRSGTVREIYSPAFLFPEVVLNDIETLALEEAGVR